MTSRVLGNGSPPMNQVSTNSSRALSANPSAAVTPRNAVNGNPDRDTGIPAPVSGPTGTGAPTADRSARGAFVHRARHGPGRTDLAG